MAKCRSSASLLDVALRMAGVLGTEVREACTGTRWYERCWFCSYYCYCYHHHSYCYTTIYEPC